MLLSITELSNAIKNHSEKPTEMHQCGVFLEKHLFSLGDNFCFFKLFLCPQSKQVQALVIPNISAILSDFQTIGEGLVRKIQVLNA